MKIHVYKWPTDKIPLNAVPFYKNDTAEFIQNTLKDLKERTEYATDYYDISTFRKVNPWDQWGHMLDYYKKYFWNDMANKVKNCVDKWWLYIVHTSFEDYKRCLTIFTMKWQYNNIIVYDLFTEWTLINISFRWFLKLLNEKFKEMWYDSVWYYFPIAHRLKPDLSREDYDKVIKLFADEDSMWFRCYIKNLK